MKPSIWDILTGVVLLGIVVMVAVFGFLLLQPGPFSPVSPSTTPVSPDQMTQATLIPTLFVPTFTATNTATNTPVASPTPTRKFTTSTPIPTPTHVILPTFTKSPRPNTGGGGSGGYGTCLVTQQTPMDGSYELAGQSFDVSWTLKNTSNKTWRSDSVDVKNTAGVGPGGALDLTYDVSPQASFQLSTRLTAPTAAGTYRSNWGLYEGTTPVCTFFVEFKIP